MLRAKRSNDDPPGLFPGWLMLGVSAAAMFMSGPGQSYSVAAFAGPMRTDLQVSETSFSLAYAVATILSGLSLPWVGRMTDRHGARRMLGGIALLLGLACLWMSLVGSLATLYVGFALVRCLGQGALTLVAVWIVGEWFSRRRGLATAMAGLGGSASVMAFPLVNGWLIASYGWPTAWRVHGAMVWLLLLPAAWLLLRDRPEDLGLLPDGDPPPGKRKDSAGLSVDQDDQDDQDGDAANDADESAPEIESAVEALTEESWSVAEVVRNPTFWKLLAVPATSGMVGTGIVFHQVRMLGEIGVTPATALQLISLQALVATLAAFGAGWLTDRMESRHLMAAAMGFLAAAIAVVLWAPDPRLAVLYAALLGLHGSIIRSTGTVVWINYYGRGNQGAVRGLASSVMILGAAAGPLPLALSVDRSGSFRGGLLLFLIVPLCALLCVWTARRPTRA